MKTFKNLFVLVAALSSLTACASSDNNIPQQTDCTYTVDMDGFSVSWIKDNSGDRTMAPGMFGASEEIVAELGIENGVPASTSAFLIKEKGNNILFDAGMGGNDSNLLRALDTLKASPESVNHILITHLHGDHIGGLTTKEGGSVFPTAQLWIPANEFESWVNQPERQSAPVKALAASYEGRLNLFNEGDELPCGIVAIPIPGHTPGHTAYQKGGVIIVGDIMHAVALQMVHPELNASFDADSLASVQSRAKIMSMAPQYILAGAHFPAPGFLFPEE